MPTVVIDKENLKRLLNREQVEVTDLFITKNNPHPHPTYLVLDPNLMLIGLHSIQDIVYLQMREDWLKKTKLK